jgi:hypothetical protein
MKLVKLLFGLLFFSVTAFSQIDVYGGRSDIHCTNTSGYFKTVKLGNRWMFCTPQGHGYFHDAVAAWTLPASFPFSKYGGDNCTTAQKLLNESRGWGFNGIGEISQTDKLKPDGPCSSTINRLPITDTIELSLYASSASFAKGQFFTATCGGPTKNMVWGNDSNSLLSFRGAGSTDVFDPAYATFANCMLTLSNSTVFNSDTTLYLLIDDTDFLAGMGGSADFDTITAGHNKPNLGYLIMTTAPVLNYNEHDYNNIPVTYSDATTYSKDLMASPPTNCGVTTDASHGPCSLATFLQKRYGSSISALNTAWVTSSFYTTFGSSGQCVGYTSTAFCGSGSGSSVETLATGNNVTSSFSHTLAVTTVSKFSVQLHLPGTNTGDCPIDSGATCLVSSGGSFKPVISPLVWSSTTGYAIGDQILDTNGYIETATIAGTSAGSAPVFSTAFHGTVVDGSTLTWRNDGPNLLTGSNPWLQDDPCIGSGSGFPAASFWANVTYHGTAPTGQTSSIPSRQVGETCLSGQKVRVTGTDGSAAGGPNPSWPTGYDVYVACRVASGSGAAFGCADAASGVPTPTLQASNIPLRQISSITCSSTTVTVNTTASHTMSIGDIVDLIGTSGGFDSTQTNVIATTPTATSLTYSVGSCPSASGSGGTIWKEYIIGNSPLTSGAALPSAPNTVNYSTGAVVLTLSAPLQTGTTITASYVANGYGIGTGILDEDGRNTTWMGHNSECLKAVANAGQAGTDSYACRPGNPGGNAAPDMHATTAVDLSDWQSNYAAKYFSTIRTAMKQPNAEPNLLYFGCDTLGDWFDPPRKEIMQGATPYLDGLFTTWLPSSSGGLAEYNYITSSLGDLPLALFSTLEANPDSAFAGSSSGFVYEDTNQAARALDWYTMVNQLLNTVTVNGDYQGVGIAWWGMYDFANEGFNWGLKTITDNAYDAHEAASGSVSCSSPLGSLTCGSEPAPGGSAVRPFGNLFGGANGLTAANNLWLNLPSYPSLDIYGGRNDVISPNSTWNGWRPEKVGNRWWIMDPANHGMHLNAMYGSGTLSNPVLTNIRTKYGASDLCRYATAAKNRLAFMGFNSLNSGWATEQLPWATSTCWPIDGTLGGRYPPASVRMPVFVQERPSFYGQQNEQVLVSDAVKDVWYPIYGYVNPGSNIPGASCGQYVPPAGEADYLDPNLYAYFRQEMVLDPAMAPYWTAPAATQLYLAGIWSDESDQAYSFSLFTGTYGSNQTFTSDTHQTLHVHGGLRALQTAPMQTATDRNLSDPLNHLYTNQQVYTKARIISDLKTKYGSIASLNTAWGSTYTSFDSTGTCVGTSAITCASNSGIESYGTTNGTAGPFTHTLATLTPTRNSVAIYVGGALVGGDTGYSGNSGSTQNQIWGPHIKNTKAGDAGPSTINYSTGALSIAFKAGTPVSIRKIVGNGSTATLTCYRQCAYWANGHITLTGTTNFNVTNQLVVSAPDPWTLTFSSAQNSTEQNTTGFGTLTFVDAAPPNGVAITVSYVANGWGAGTGVLDEDGRHAWTGMSNGFSPGASCSLAQSTYVNDASQSAGFRTDMANALSAMASTYFSSIYSEFTQSDRFGSGTNRKVMLLGPDNMGGANSPSAAVVYQAAAPYVDAIIMTPRAFSASLNQTEIDYINTYLGDKPVMFVGFLTAQADSEYFNYSVEDTSFWQFNTQAERGQGWYDLINGYINSSYAANNSNFLVGASWWISYGPVDGLSADKPFTELDNIYDGLEPTNSSRACSLSTPSVCGDGTLPCSCGGETLLPSWQNSHTYVSPAPNSGTIDRIQATSPTDGLLYIFEARTNDFADLSQVAVGGGNATYSWSNFRGTTSPLAIGMRATITGFVNSGNNVTGLITAVTGTTSGTFILTLTTQVNETHSGSVNLQGTSASSPPTWPNTEGTTVTDATETWKNVGRKSGGANTYGSMFPMLSDGNNLWLSLPSILLSPRSFVSGASLSGASIK